MDMIYENNYIRLCGVMTGPPVYSHSSRGQMFYTFPLEIRRLSGNTDTVNIVLRREKLAELPQLTGVFVSGAGLSGAAQAVDDAGLSGKVKIVGFDVTDSNVAFMKKGTVQFLIDQGPYLQGYQSIQLLTDAIFQDRPVAAAYYDTGIQIKNLYNC